MKPFEESDRYIYDLSPDDLVINVGGFHGDWASHIFDRYGCRLIIFEPVKSHYEGIVSRFAGNPKIEVHHVAIGGRHGMETIYVAGDSSGVHRREDAAVEEVPMWSATDMIRWTKRQDIALLELNAEGSEYSIVSSLLRSKLMPRIRSLQVQWHFLDPTHEGVYRGLREQLLETHDETWGAGHVWENYRRK